MPTYDVMIEYRVDTTGVMDWELTEGLEQVSHRMQDLGAVVALHGDVLTVNAEIEESGPSAALGALEIRFDVEMTRVALDHLIDDTTSFWATDTERMKARLVLMPKDKTA